MSVQDLASRQLAQELREALGRVVRRLRADPVASAGRLAVLSRLELDGPSSIGDLAARARMRPQSMAQTVNELQTTGLVSRGPDPAGSRRALIELTPAGLNLLQTTTTQRETWLVEVLEREFDAGEREQLREALALLSRIADG